VATATTGFFRALGGAIGAAALGAVFASRGGVIDGVQTVFLVAAPLAALALVIVFALPEAPLARRAGSGRETAEPAEVAA
jgi:MFS family permease